MGTRILSEALHGLSDTGFKGTAVREVVLAAADVNTAEFRDYLLPKMRERFKFRTTVYMSKNDFPLKVSRRMHEYPRLGDPTDERYLQDGIDVVDASAIAPMRRSWGHSYLWDNPAVAGDFGRLINEGRGAAQRALKAVTAGNGLTYWEVD
jgi:esterase/lipase superfamily enzyme